ncbi:MAG: VanZ family protein [Spirochaetales bacterium]|nr:VanZ family protein [Spirochaetales bacterium]
MRNFPRVVSAGCLVIMETAGRGNYPDRQKMRSGALMAARRLLQAAFFSAAVFILVFSLIPKIIINPPGIDWFDKLLHTSVYTVLGVLSFLSFIGERRSVIQKAVLLVILLSLYGGIIEVLQSFTGRTPDIFDFFSDSIGASVGVGSCFVICFLKRKSKHHAGNL